MFLDEGERKKYEFKADDKIQIGVKPASSGEGAVYVRREYRGGDWDVISSAALASLKGVLG